MTLHRPDQNCLSFWFPQLRDAGLPVPKTIIVKYPDGWKLANLLDGENPPDLDEFIRELT